MIPIAPLSKRVPAGSTVWRRQFLRAVNPCAQGRIFQLVEEHDGAFALRGTSQREFLDCPARRFILRRARRSRRRGKTRDIVRGAQVELVLQPNRSYSATRITRRALDFIEGIVRSQIDRLTPWSAAEAAFGWHPSIDAAMTG